MIGESQIRHEHPLEYVACIEGALIECAQSDWWYEHEKNYDDDPEPPEENEDE